jgi:hypothetical protein
VSALSSGVDEEGWSNYLHRRDVWLSDHESDPNISGIKVDPLNHPSSVSNVVPVTHSPTEGWHSEPGFTSSQVDEYEVTYIEWVPYGAPSQLEHQFNLAEKRSEALNPY